MFKNVTTKLIFSLCSILLLVAFFVFIFNSETGLQGVLYFTGKIVPGELIIKNAKGKLVSPIYIENFSYKNTTTNITLENLELNWNLSDLVENTFHIKNLSAKNIVITTAEQNLTVNLSPTEKLQKITALKNWHFPIKLKLDDVNLQNLKFARSNFDSILLQAYITDVNLWQVNTTINSKDAKLTFLGKLNKTWQVEWHFHVPMIQQILPDTLGDLESNGYLTGELKNPQISVVNTLNDFRYQDFALNKLQNKIAINFSAPQLSTFNFTLEKFKTKNYNCDKLLLDGVVNKKDKGFSSVVSLSPLIINTQFNKFKKISFAKTAINIDANSTGVFAKTSLLTSLLQNPIAGEVFWNFSDIKGKASWQTNNLNYFKEIFVNSSTIKNLTGKLSADISLTSFFPEPKFNGKVVLSNANFDVPKINLSPRNINAEVDFLGRTTDYHARLNSGDGILNISGKTTFDPKANSKFFGDTTIVGNNFLVANTPEYKILLSPNLQLKSANDRFYLTGKVTMPSATIKPRNFGSVVTMPRETVFVTTDTKQNTFQTFPLYSQIELILGDNVNIDLFDITGKLTGAIKIFDEPSRTTLGLGILTLKNGTYNLYGQPLQITNGTANYYQSDIANPEISMTAVRNIKATLGSSMGIQNITVGMLTKGKVDNLRTTLFSVPSGLSQTDIFSYLALGAGGGDVSQNKLQLVLKAASFLNFGGVGAAQGLLGDIQKHVGLSEISLGSEEISSNKNTTNNTTTTTSNTSLILGKYLSPKLYIGYSVGLLDPVNIFRIRYTLDKNWYLQSESSSTGNGGDIIYTIEK